jgi:hypothetical protein
METRPLPKRRPKNGSGAHSEEAALSLATVSLPIGDIELCGAITALINTMTCSASCRRWCALRGSLWGKPTAHRVLLGAKDRRSTVILPILAKGRPIMLLLMAEAYGAFTYHVPNR